MEKFQNELAAADVLLKIACAYKAEIELKHDLAAKNATGRNDDETKEMIKNTVAVNIGNTARQNINDFLIGKSTLHNESLVSAADGWGTNSFETKGCFAHRVAHAVLPGLSLEEQMAFRKIFGEVGKTSTTVFEETKENEKNKYDKIIKEAEQLR